MTISSNDIAWFSDKEYKFSNIKGNDKDYRSIQWLDMQDEHFIVWMRTAGLPNFRKLYGRINQDLQVGQYTLTIGNNFDVAPYSGKKSFVLSTTNALGGKNYFLALCYIVVGVLCMLFAIVFLFAFVRKRGNNSDQN